MATANPRRTRTRRSMMSTTGSRARAISRPMLMRVSIAVELANTASTASTTSTARSTAKNVAQSSLNRGASRCAHDDVIANGDASAPSADPLTMR